MLLALKHQVTGSAQARSSCQSTLGAALQRFNMLKCAQPYLLKEMRRCSVGQGPAGSSDILQCPPLKVNVDVPENAVDYLSR